jgi:hypothetical protein
MHRATGCQVFVPGQERGSPLQFTKRAGVEGPEANQHAAGGAEPEVGTRQRLPIAFEGDATRLRGDALAAQRDQLSSGEFFQSRGTDGEKA